MHAVDQVVVELQSTGDISWRGFKQFNDPVMYGMNSVAIAFFGSFGNAGSR